MQFTKKINLKTKLIAALLAVVLTICFMVPASVFTISASAVSVDWDSVVVSGLNQTEYDIYSEIELPSVQGATFTLVNPRGKTLKSNESANDGYTFTADIAGTYRVSYANGNATTGIINLNVVAKEVSFEFASNTDKIIPSTIAKATKVVFPNPSIIDSKGEVIEGASATISLLYANDNELQNLSEETIDSVVYKTFTFNKVGNYVLSYAYGGDSTSKAARITKTYNIEVKEDYETEQEISFTLQSTMPTSAVQGVEVTLPKVNGKNADNQAISVYTAITVNHVAESGKTAMEVNDFKFKPTLAGNYEILYTVSDFFGNKIEKTYYINDVADTKAPTIYLVADYTVTEGEPSGIEKDLDDNIIVLDGNMPTVIPTNTTISIPAIYAEDNVVEYKDLTLSRNIKKGTSSIIAYLDNKEDYPNNNVYEAVDYTFTEAGTYTVIYNANDNSGSGTASRSFTIVVKGDMVDTQIPTVTVTDFVYDENGTELYAVKTGQNIKVAYPKVVDLVDPSDPSNTNVWDTNPKLRVFMFDSSVQANVFSTVESIVENDNVSVYDALDKAVNEANIVSFSELKLDSDKKYFEGQVPSASMNSLSILYVSQDDSERMGFYTSSLDDHVLKTIAVIDTLDTIAPEFTNDFEYLENIEANQYEVVSLSFFNLDTDEYENISVLDTQDPSVKLNIVVVGPNGENISLSNYEQITTALANGSTTSATAEFNANLAGIYTVRFIAVDAGNNISVKATTIEVVSMATPSIVLSNYNTIQELGNVVIPKAFAYLDGVQQDDSWISTTIVGDINTHNSVVIVKYIATNPDNELSSEEVTAQFTVKDTINPTITFEQEVSQYAKLILVEGSQPDEYEPIDVPAFTVSDFSTDGKTVGSGVDFSTIKITAVDNKGNTVKLIDSDNNTVTEIKGDSSAFKFIPTGDGKYTLTFSAQDNAGNSVSTTRTIAVGDITGPTLTISNSNDIPTSATLKNGEYTLSLKIDSDTVQINDAKDGDLSINEYLSVVVTGPSGATVSGEDYTYTLTEAGTYTITYTAVDKADNSTVKTFKVVVSAENNGGSTVTEVVGTVLLILSILVLAGVVWYFVKPAPKGNRTAKKEEKKEDKKDE